MLELQDILNRLRQGQSIKGIRRELGRHKTIIRKVKRIAVEQGWLEREKALPSEGDLRDAYEKADGEARHILWATSPPDAVAALRRARFQGGRLFRYTRAFLARADVPVGPLHRGAEGSATGRIPAGKERRWQQKSYWMGIPSR